MARILTDESTLTRRRRSLAAETRALGIVSYVEAGLAACLLLAGLAAYLWKGRAGWLIAGGMVAFLFVGHMVRVRQSRREHSYVTAGLRGEVEVTHLLERALGNDTYILNDISLRSGRKRAQIDHLVVSPKGLFVLETKNWRGEIVGDERERRWTQLREPGTRPVTVSNPILQNQRHVEVLNACLRAAGIQWPDVFSVVVMTSSRAEWKVANQTVPVLKPVAAAELIERFQAPRAYTEAQVDQVAALLMKTR